MSHRSKSLCTRCTQANAFPAIAQDTSVSTISWNIFYELFCLKIETFIIHSWNGKCKESNCGSRKILASLWLSSAHPNFVKRREKLFPVIEFHFYRNIYALFLKKMGWLWECLEMIFRMFPVYTQKTVPQRYLFFSICIGTSMYPSCQIMLRRLFNWYVTFFRKNILSFCIFPIGLHIFVKLHSSVHII